MSFSSLQPLMKPRSIAVIGASQRVGSRGNSAIRNLQEFGFRGAIYPVNPTADEINGLKVYRSPLDLPEPADCAIVAVPAESVVQVMEQSAEAGIRSAVIFASGFAETGEEGAERQRRLTEVAKRGNIAVCGPNCLGLANVTERISLYSSQVPGHIRAGGLAVISQSGSGCILLSNLRRFGFSYLVTTGNNAVLDVADYLDFVSEDPDTKLAALFMETINDPARFASALGKMRDAGKPVVALKVGRSRKGAAAAAAHTGSLAGAREAYDDFFGRNGVVAVDDLDELVESIALMQDVRIRPKGRGVAVINVSGGEVALACDIAEQIGLELPDLAPQTVTRLKGILPDFGHAANPLDATGAAVTDLDMYGGCIRALADDPNIAVVAVSQDSPADLSERQGARYGKLAAVAAGIAGEIDKPLVFYNNLAGDIHPEIAAPLAAAGVPALQGARAGLLAIRRLIDVSAFAPATSSVSDATEWSDSQVAFWNARLSTGKPLSEAETRAFLKAHGIDAAGGTVVGTAGDALQAAAALKGPVAMKIVSPDLPHKTEAGGVALNVSPGEAGKVFDRIMAAVAAHAPSARLDGVSVERMITGGTEVIIGLSRQAPFGQMMTVGAGGVLVELFKDSAAALLPLGKAECLDLLKRTRVWRLLEGYRGGAAADVEALVDLMAALSRIGLVYSDRIEALELNPVSVQPAGRGLAILDALLLPRAGESAGTSNVDAEPQLGIAV